jgi:hypothetical protein
VTHALFELASDHNIVGLDATTPPLFTQRILLVGTDGRPFCAMIGAGVGDMEPVTRVGSHRKFRRTVSLPGCSGLVLTEFASFCLIEFSFSRPHARSFGRGASASLVIGVNVLGDSAH